MRGSTAGLIVALALGLLATPVAAEAQGPAKVPRIGFLSLEVPAAISDHMEAFQQGLRDLGYAEGQNIVIVYRFAQGNVKRLPDLVADLVRLKVDVSVAVSTPAAQAAKGGAGPTPVVFTQVGDPVASGLVRTLAQPGGTSPDSQSSQPSSAASAWSCSRRWFPGPRGWPSCGIRGSRSGPSF